MLNKWPVLIRMMLINTDDWYLLSIFSMSGSISSTLHEYFINKAFAFLLLITSKSFPLSQNYLKVHKP